MTVNLLKIVIFTHSLTMFCCCDSCNGKDKIKQIENILKEADQIFINDIKEKYKLPDSAIESHTSKIYNDKWIEGALKDHQFNPLLEIAKNKLNILKKSKFKGNSMIFYRMVGGSVKKLTEYVFELYVEVDANKLKELNQGLPIRSIPEANSYESEIKEAERIIRNYTK